MKYNKMASTPTQRERLSADQVENNAGGFVYEISNIDRLRRFLILGTEGGTYYANQGDHTRQALTFLTEMASKDPLGYWNTLLDVASNNLAARHSPTLYALAVLRRGTKDPTVQTHIRESFTAIVRTGTHLFEYVDYDTSLGGWGRGLRSLVSSWYVTKDADRLAYLGVKYRQRGGWTHRDLLRKAHPNSTDPGVKGVLDYLAHGMVTVEDALVSEKFTTINEDIIPDVIRQYEQVKRGSMSPLDAEALTWEMLPTDALTSPALWRELVSQHRLPATAMLRNLGRMTANGALDYPKTVREIVDRLRDPEHVRGARLHPFNILTASKTYASGGGFRGSMTWTPKARIIDALSDAFSHSFQNVTPTGKRILIALDVSGSMALSTIMNSNVTPREGSAAMALAMLAGDPDTTDVMAFSDGSRGGRIWSAASEGALTPLPLSPRQRLDDAIDMVSNLQFGATDCALPVVWAGTRGKEYDAFVVITDSETYCGSIHPSEALRSYRKNFVPDARMVVVGMTATEFSIADPDDRLSLDVAGFDASAPSLIANFVAGRF